MALTGSTNEQKIWNFLYGKLANAYGAAGLMGNLYAESGLVPNNLQNSYNTKLGMTDAEYTAAVDDGSYTNFVKDSAGYGLAQWTYYSRKQNLLNYVTTQGTSIGDLESQLNFLYNELSSGYSSVLKTLKAATSVLEASNAVLTGYEKPADQSDTAKTKRANYGQTYYDKYAGGASNSSTSSSTTTTTTVKASTTYPTCPFLVKVIVDDLNIRSGAGMSYEATGVTGKGSFTITEVTNDWGKLKSGAGYIYLGNSNYVTIGSTVASTTTTTTTTTSASSSYLVKVTANILNVRKGAGTNYAIVGKIKDKGTYTIVKTQIIGVT